MSLLESVLINCNAEQYLPNFDKYEIEVSTLKILSDEDLQIVGIEDKEIRKAILKQAANLKIPAEEKTNIVLDKQYIQTVVDSSADQLDNYFSNLCIAYHREDINICNIKVTPSITCLENCLDSLEQQVENFSRDILDRKIKEEKKSRKRLLVIPVLVITAAVITKLIIHNYR